MRLKCQYIIVPLIGIWLISGLCVAQIRLPQLISDGMVLQRDSKINMWGRAAPGEKITISFNHKNYKTVTGANSKWAVLLPAMKAGGPYTMGLRASNQIIIHNILIGDVWVCSGQSNMVLPMERVKEKYPHEITGADYPQIRNFFIATVSDLNAVHDDLPPGQWKEANPKNVLAFGAASYFFAKQLYEQYHVPIGIINSSVGGTPIQAWISENGLKGISAYTDRLMTLRDTAYLNHLQRTTQAANESEKLRTKTSDKGLQEPKKWYDTSYRADGWPHFWLPGYWADQGVRGLNGVVWFRKEIDVPAALTGKPAKLFMGRVVDADQTYVNGVQVGNITYQYPPRRYELPANLLKPGKNIIVVRVVNTQGKGGFVPDKPYRLIVGGQTIDLRGDWRYKVGQVFAPAVDFGDDGRFSVQNEPTSLYNAMVAPLIPYRIKGIVWYQGEANTTRRAPEYEQLLPALIADWRSRWNEGEIPFVYVQLPGFMEVEYLPAESHWAEVREAELNALAVPNTAMAVAIDAGEWNDVHPLDKKDVGERLALGAEKIAYGDSNIVASGPIFKSAKVDGHKIIISFANTGSGLMVKGGGELTQFAIAGEDRKYVWAKAQIVGDKVIVWSDELQNPVYVRYAWADNPEGANLYNKENLPASPFTTDVQ